LDSCPLLQFPHVHVWVEAQDLQRRQNASWGCLSALGIPSRNLEKRLRWFTESNRRIMHRTSHISHHSSCITHFTHCTFKHQTSFITHRHLPQCPRRCSFQADVGCNRLYSWWPPWDTCWENKSKGRQRWMVLSQWSLGQITSFV
jgi:hypothetical protein